MNRRILSFLLPLLMVAGAAGASEQDCTTDPAAVVGGLPVAADASFSTDDNGNVAVTVTNLQADPRSAAQLLNGVSFTLSDGETNGTLTTDTAATRVIGAGGKFANYPATAMGWAMSTDGAGGFTLCDLCTDLGAVGPKHLLIGAPAASGLYLSANGSLALNQPHNPFTAGSASFFINVPGVTSNTTITGATFFFGTQAGVSAPASCTGGGGLPS